MEILFTFQTFFRIFLSLILGGLIGLERQVMGKAAGLRTHMLISMGSATFTLISIFISGKNQGADISRIPAMILSGIGFIGAGAIIQARGHIQGLTTAASIWATAAIGMACGFGYLSVALISTFFALIVLHGLTFLETKISPLKSIVLDFPSAEDFHSFFSEMEKHNLSISNASIKKTKDGKFILRIEGNIPSSLLKIFQKELK